jgi:hypothetical protein
MPLRQQGQQVRAALNLGYILLIPFTLFAGYAITLDFWVQAFRRGGFLNCGAAVWNTYASIHNTYSAWRNLGGPFTSLGNLFGARRTGGRDRDGNGSNGVIVVLLLVALALLGGVMTTAVIIRRCAATDPLPPPSESPEYAHAKSQAG